MTEEQKCKVTFWSPHNKNMETGFRRGLIPSFLATWFSSASKSITSERHFEFFDRLCRLNTGGSAFRISLVRAPNCMYICIPSSGRLHQAYVIMPLHDLSHFSLLMTLIYTWRTLHSRRLTLSSFTASLSLSPLSIVLYLACSCVALRRGDWPKNRFVKFSRCLSFRSQHRSWGFCLRGQQSRRAAHQSRVLLMGLLGFLLGASLSSSTITTVGGAQGLPADAFTQSSGCQICLTLLFRSCCASWLHSTALLLFKHSCTLQPCTRYCCPTLRMYQKWGMEIYNFIFLLHHIISSCTMLILGRFAF